MANSSTSLVQLSKIKHEHELLRLDYLRYKQHSLLIDLSMLETRLESGQLRYAAQRRHLITLESNQPLTQGSFHEHTWMCSKVKEIQLAAAEQDMANKKFQEEIVKTKAMLAKFEIEVGVMVDSLEELNCKNSKFVSF